MLGKAIVAPGLWLQRVTTREPDEQQLDVALVALRSALGVEGGRTVSDIMLLLRKSLRTKRC